MDPTTVGLATPIILAGVGTVAWAIRLEGRLTTHEETDKLRFDNLDASLKEVKTGVNSLVEHLLPRQKDKDRG